MKDKSKRNRTEKLGREAEDALDNLVTIVEEEAPPSLAEVCSSNMSTKGDSFLCGQTSRTLGGGGSAFLL